MKKLVKIFVVTVVWFGLAVTAVAQHPIEPFMSLSITPDKIDLGSFSGFGQELPAQLEAHIVANFPYHIKASFTGFTHQDGDGSIPNEQTSVVINGKDVPVASNGVSIISSTRGTPIGGVNVPVYLKFGVDSVMQYPAGTYGGKLVFIIIPRL